MGICSMNSCAMARISASGSHGGPLVNRARLLLEVTDAVISVWGANRVGVRISPLNSFNAMRDSDPLALTAYVATQLNARNIAYLHLMRGDFSQVQKGDVVSPARTNFTGALVGNMGYSAQEAAAAIDAGTLQAVALGHHYVSNPDLVERLKAGVALVEPDSKTFYTQDAKGYTDYPVMASIGIGVFAQPGTYFLKPTSVIAAGVMVRYCMQCFISYPCVQPCLTCRDLLSCGMPL
jgi:2,4-dienoyl-CoA reductase-like NADH-dependent reductase (Old Yellow Enzyme family)